MKKNKLTIQISTIIILFFVFSIGCKRNEVINPNNSNTTPVNDAIQVTASVSGIVLDESNVPIANAVVINGSANTTTNSNGIFVFNNISISKENGSVTVTKAGYFKGIRSFKTIAGKNNAVRIQLMQKILSGSINSTTGGIVNSNGSATISFPQNAFVTSTGAAYTGVVKVYSRWINPTTPNLGNIIPGDLRGVKTNGIERVLTTFGMVGAELEDANGNTLKLASGKKASVSFPIPTSLSNIAPTIIPLWHFDEATARWKEEGTATKTGNQYIAEVNKFSFWNVDEENEFINLDFTLINSVNNTPLVNTSTRIKVVSDGTYGYGITNNSGFIFGAVPKNEALVLEVLSNCNSIIYTQNIGPFTTNSSLGNINISLSSNQFINFSGKVVNCNNTPVTDGYISFYGTGGNNAFVSTSATGSFAFTILNCTGNSLAYNYQATDYTASQQSNSLTGAALSGAVNLGTISACGNAAGLNVYVGGEMDGKATIWKNNIPYFLNNGNTRASVKAVFVSGTDVYAIGNDGDTAKLWKNNTSTIFSNGANKINLNSLFVSGNDVYITGVEVVGQNTIVKLWKNGVVSNLSTLDYLNESNSVFVSGADVYVAGSIASVVKVWKNGVMSDPFGPSTYGSLSSIYVNNNDIYLAGRLNNISYVWKNNNPTSLMTSSNNHTSSIFVEGSNVYVTGYEYIGSNFVGKVWKNGVASTLTNPNNDGRTLSVFSFGPDVYVTGFENINGTYKARLWKNGIMSTLPGSTIESLAYSVFVK